jgi:hypothetical protein
MLKKLIVVGVVLVAGYVAYNRFSSARAERDLWNEATAVPDIA